MKDLQPNILDDFEHRVNRLIETRGSEPGFPQMETYNTTREVLDDYLFDYQALLDSEGSVRTQQTIYGLISLLPILAISAFPRQSMPWNSDVVSLLVGLLIGFIVALAIKLTRVAIKRMGLRKLRAANPDVAAYVDAVDRYEQ